MRKKWLRLLLLIPVVLFILYIIGPSPSTPVYSKEIPVVPAPPIALESIYKERKNCQEYPQ